MRLSTFAFAAAALAAPAQLSAAEYGDARMGRALAETWCQACHVIGPDPGATAQPALPPPFPVIARGMDEERRKVLRAWLMAPHGAMPNLSLTRAEIADLLAYIETLKPAE